LQSIGEYAKQLQALIAAVLPLLTAKINVLYFLNPQISSDLWVITAIISMITSFALYNWGGKREALIGLAVAFASIVLLIALVATQFLSEFPRTEDFAARILFLTLFVGLGASMGASLSQVLKNAPVTPGKP
jgi:hypothetical protein